MASGNKRFPTKPYNLFYWASLLPPVTVTLSAS